MSRILDDCRSNQELLQLPARYAAGIDRRDVDLFLSAFHDDATLTVMGADPTTFRSHAELARVIELIDRYDKTFHFVGQVLIDVDGDRAARGEVYCTAYHWREEQRLLHRKVMYIRYRDEYRCGADGHWRIATRTVQTDRTETEETPR
jgi:ketosteroid isomerase-like protein